MAGCRCASIRSPRCCSTVPERALEQRGVDRGGRVAGVQEARVTGQRPRQALDEARGVEHGDERGVERRRSWTIVAAAASRRSGGSASRASRTEPDHLVDEHRDAAIRRDPRAVRTMTNRAPRVRVRGIAVDADQSREIDHSGIGAPRTMLAPRTRTACRRARPRRSAAAASGLDHGGDRHDAADPPDAAHEPVALALLEHLHRHAKIIPHRFRPLQFRAVSGTAFTEAAETRLAALRQLRRSVRPSRAHTLPDAAPEETLAYLELTAACGYAHLGAPRKAEALIDTAHAALAGAARDEPVHGYLLAAFEARIRGTSLPPLAALNRVDRYRVDRVREVSRFLEPTATVSAIETFSRRGAEARPRVDALPEAFAAARAGFARDVDAAAAQVEALLVDPLAPDAALDDIIAHVDRLARVIAPAPYALALAWLDRVADTWIPRATDGTGRRLSTEGFYCRAALAVADALVGSAVARG